MFTRILVPLDGSPLAERALGPAEELSRLTGAPLLLVRVADATRLAPYGPDAPAFEYAGYQQVLEEEERAARAYLRQIEAQLAERGVSATSEVRWGLAAPELVALVQPGDRIVMATHGRGGLARWFLGSVAEQVVRLAPVPVLLVRSEAAGEPATEAAQEPQLVAR